jgi:3-dehydroquinate dehydratase-2
MKVCIINGPNLNLLGVREKSIYGSQSFNTYLKDLKAKFPQIDIEFYQSNIEGELIDKLQSVGFSSDAIILNAGAYTHTSLAIADAISAISTPVIEVHISNVHAREPIRSQSFIASKCTGTISGFGLDSYRLAIESLL